jgi:hypothetical protein
MAIGSTLGASSPGTADAPATGGAPVRRHAAQALAGLVACCLACACSGVTTAQGPANPAMESGTVAPVEASAAASAAPLGAAPVSAATPVSATPPASLDEVIDFSLIQASDMVIQPDPSGTSATISVNTSIDAACAVVFGTDTMFGRLATDKDMGGAAHKQHHVVLGGLVPGTTYVFRFQGSAIDGRLYRSHIYTFTTPVPSASAPVDLALGARVVDVSSEYSADFAAANAVDGDPSTEWSTRGDGDNAFITLDLGSPTAIAAVEFQTRSMSDGSATTHSFTVTANGTTYGPFPADESAPLQVTAQVLRFDVATSTGGNTGATEIEIFGADPTP